MKEIPLTRGYVALVDDEDYERVVFYGPWQVDICAGKHFYARRGVTKTKEPARLHRFILGVTDPSIFVDHIDHDGLNCTRANMRTCTRAENSRNQMRRSRKNPSPYKGVYPQGPSWVSRIVCREGAVRKFIGSFDNPADAARAYDVEARKLFGKFACCNFPEVAQ